MILFSLSLRLSEPFPGNHFEFSIRFKRWWCCLTKIFFAMHQQIHGRKACRVCMIQFCVPHFRNNSRCAFRRLNDIRFIRREENHAVAKIQGQLSIFHCWVAARVKSWQCPRETCRRRCSCVNDPHFQTMVAGKIDSDMTILTEILCGICSSNFRKFAMVHKLQPSKWNF